MAMDVEIRYLQDIERQAIDTPKAVKATNEIAGTIKAVIDGKENPISRQAVLNMAFRFYYKLIYKHKLKDVHFESVVDAIPTEKQVGDFEVLYAILLSDRGKFLKLDSINGKCLDALFLHDAGSTLIILKNLNFLQRKRPSLNAEITLAQIYVHLQSNEFGMRDEALNYFSYCCRSRERARQYFQFIVEKYPWTNRNKYYMLSCILNTHDVEDLLQFTSHNPKDFFDGLRLSLNYKHLLPASQYLVKALSKQNSYQLLEMSADILWDGTGNELEHFYTQWYPRILQKCALFRIFQDQVESEEGFQRFLTETSTSRHCIYIFVMNSRRIMSKSKVLFFKLTTEFFAECFALKMVAQLLIYKFVADNMDFFALEDCLEFLFSFIRHHRNTENAQVRNNVLSKIPTIINYISKTYFKMQKSTDGNPSSLNVNVEVFFSQLHQIIVNDIESKIYQPKIFALKLLDILLRSLYQQNLEKNTKNCNLEQNQEFGALLISHRIFNATQMSKQLLKVLYDPLCFNDALDLMVDLLPRLGYVESQPMVDSCKMCCQSVDIDECALGPYYARVALNGLGNEDMGTVLYQYAMEMLRTTTPIFHEDPLLCCKERHHLFGFLDVLNAALLAFIACEQPIEDLNFEEVLEFLEKIQGIVLEFLNSTGECEEQKFAASFQDMDNSLEILVRQSKFKAENHEECRKFLMISFWLTLKACCEVATTLGCLFSSKYNRKYQTVTEYGFIVEPTATVIANIQQNAGYLKDLLRCLNMNVFVLTRCRHKGAIEAVGLSIGKLTRHMTLNKNLQAAKINETLWNCLLMLFENDKSVSTTRRGAGFSIMFLHIVKNDTQPGRPLLTRAMAHIFEILKNQPPSSTSQDSNCDRIETLVLHYLCVLVKDAEIRNSIFPYYNDIMLAAIEKIDDPDWTVCNAALQLFGALVPKVVGQRQATEFEEPSNWEVTLVTYAEILHIMPKTFEHILNYCKEQADNSTSTRSIILFLGFLSKIEHLPQDVQETDGILYRVRELMWTLLQHQNERIRKLAAACYVRSHDFRSQLPHALLFISDLLFEVKNENFFVGLLFVICEGMAKMQNEALYTVGSDELEVFYDSFRDNILEKAKFEMTFKRYTQSKFLEMLRTIGLTKDSCIVTELINFVTNNAGDVKFDIGHDDWLSNIERLNTDTEDSDSIQSA